MDTRSSLWLPPRCQTKHLLEGHGFQLSQAHLTSIQSTTSLAAIHTSRIYTCMCSTDSAIMASPVFALPDVLMSETGVR